MRNANLRDIYFRERERARSQNKVKETPIPKNICPSLKLGLLRYGFDVKVKHDRGKAG
jgi:hypothetical protein